MKQLLTSGEMYELLMRGVDIDSAGFKKCDIDGKELICDRETELSKSGENPEYLFSLSDLMSRLPQKIEDRVTCDTGILTIGPDPETGFWYCRYEVWVNDEPGWNIVSGTAEELIDAVYHLYKQLLDGDYVY